MQRTAIIHIGTHKTGTSSQQYFLMQHAEELARAGLLFPKSGWYGVVPGHHAVAWELCAGNFSGPEFTALIEEVRDFQGHACVLSAEDFSLLYSRPEALDALKSAFESIGYRIKILAYLRAQGSYAESMYVERVKHDHVRKVADYIDEIVATGRYSGASLPIEFRYSRLIAPFERIFGYENVNVRVYQGVRDLSLVFSDFLKTIASLASIYQNANIQIEIAHPIVNESLSFLRLLGVAFTRLLKDEDVPQTAEEFAARYAPELPRKWWDTRFALFSREDYLRILEAVAADNQAVLQRYSAKVPFMTQSDVAPPEAPIWEEARVERTIYDRFLETYLV